MEARRRRSGAVRERDEHMCGAGVIASPTLACAGWLADGRMPGAAELGLPAEVYNTAVQNVTGHPAISLPAGRCDNGVPFGLQITGPRFRDAMLVDLAEAWERVAPWPLVAEGYEPFGV